MSPVPSLTVFCLTGLMLAATGCAALDETSGSVQPPPQTAADTLSLAALADTLSPIEAARYAVRGRDPERKDGPLAKIGLKLAHLYFAHRAHEREAPPGSPFEPPAGMSVAGGHVLIDATATERGTQLEAELERLGMEDGAAAGPVVSGRFPVARLPEAAALEPLRSMRPSRAATSERSNPVPSPPLGPVHVTVANDVEEHAAMKGVAIRRR